MAEEVEITNVGGDTGVASEATLVGLTRAIEKLAASTGRDPKKEAAKVQRLHTRTLQEDIKAIEEKIKAQEEYTSVLRRSTRAMGSLLSGITNLVAGGIGLLTSSVTQFADTVISGDESLSGLVKSIPVFGSVLSRFTDIIDDSFDAFQSMATSGAAFSYDLGELRNSSRELRLSFGELGSFVTQNSTRLAAFGGTVDQGIRSTRALSEALGSDVRQQFTAMGLTAEELNEQLAFFQFVTRAGVRQDQIDRNNQAAAVESLTKNMLTLSKLTGKDIQQQREAMAQAQMDMAFQMEMARLTESQRAAMQQALSEAQAVGPEAVEFVKRTFLGMAPFTEEGAVFAATQAEVVRELANTVDAARNIREEDLAAFTSPEQLRQRLGRLFEAQVDAANRNEVILRAGAAGLGGVASTIADQFGTSAEFVGQFLRENADGTIRFATEEFLANMEAAGNNMTRGNTELDAIAAFREGLREARESLTKNLTNPLLNAISPSLAAVAGSFRDFVGQEGESTKFQTAINFMREKIEGVVPKIQQFIDAFAADPEQAISDLVNDIGNFFRDAIFGKMMNVGGDDPTEVIMERQGGLIQSLRNGIIALFSHDSVLTSLMNGITTVTNGLREGFSEFWNSSESDQLREDIKSMFRMVIDEIVLMISSYTPFFGGRAEEIRENRTRSAAESGTFTPQELEQRNEIVRLQEQQISNMLDMIRHEGTLNDTYQDLFADILAELSEYSTDEQMQGYLRDAEQARQEYIDNQIASFMSPLNTLQDMISNFENTEFQDTRGLLGLGARTADENRENARESILEVRDRILNELQGMISDLGPNEQVESLIRSLNNLQGFNQGTKGFEDFGTGTLAMLHGKEAVIPLDSPLGQMISNINTGAAVGRSRTAQMPGLDFENRSQTQRSTPKVEIENISVLTENLTDIKNQLVSTMNTANQGSLESIKQLNMLMSQMLTVVQEMAEDSDQIERNTRSTGSNIANGRVSTVR